jgi:Cytidylate kinase-like family
MAVWTVAAQEGTGGARVAGELAAAAGVSLIDREELGRVAHELDPTFPLGDDLERRLGGRLNALALSTAISIGSADALSELHLRQTLPGLGRGVLAQAACSPCVIYAPGAFAALSEHPSAVHVCLRAPLEWRIATYQRERLVDRRCAEKELKHDDHRRQAWVRSLYHVDIDDTRLFSLVLDASRFSPERLVETLLAAGGVQAAVMAP